MHNAFKTPDWGATSTQQKLASSCSFFLFGATTKVQPITFGTKLLRCCSRRITKEGTPLVSGQWPAVLSLSAVSGGAVWADMFGGGVPGNYEKSGPENGKIVIVPLITHAGDADMQPVLYSIKQRPRIFKNFYFNQSTFWNKDYCP